MSKSRGRPAAQPLTPPPGGVAVRMYRQGLGDCFLLAFAAGKGQRPTYVLIDCGVHHAQPDGTANLRAIMDDIGAATADHLDILVATHQHSDHLSGFVNHPGVLNGQWQIDELWLAWTENPDDSLARQLQRGRQAAHTAVEAALQRLREKALTRPIGLIGGSPEAALADRLQSMSFDFQAEAPSATTGLAAASDASIGGNELALAALREAADTVRYLTPGETVLQLPRAAAARAYVLGPPRSISSLKKSDPSTGAKQETYLTLAGLDSFAVAAAGQSAFGDSEEAAAREDLCNPFSRDCRVSYGLAALDPSFQRYAFHDPKHRSAWRAIESDWLFAVEELALAFDDHTNNTSVALAFEVGQAGAGRVLLFPADAQVGSWLSWQSLQWPGGSLKIGTADLFRRTALYKVGHHASHNATLKFGNEGAAYGLELMPDGLIAMIPVDETVARKLRGWNMPAPNLYAALLKKTHGNLLRSDGIATQGLRLPRLRTAAVPDVLGAKWRCSKSTKTDGSPLFYDVFMEG